MFKLVKLITVLIYAFEYLKLNCGGEMMQMHGQYVVVGEKKLGIWCFCSYSIVQWGFSLLF